MPTVTRYFAYIRVSTAKQGEGVSLQEQQDAINRYAEREDLQIAEWFEETVTAAKRGRPAFTRMLKLLRRGKADGIIIHKIDRGARNLKDWADLGELIDSGLDVHFANESLDLSSRGGRLSADIQAVVAADYIRNLREETRKGFYGRLKQGLYPLPAPIGYLDRGGGKPKELDPTRAPLVRELFELYASGRHSLRSLRTEAQRLGLTNRRGGRLSRTGLSILLNNPFYIGLIRIKKTGETFQGIHEPLVSTTLFNRVRRVLEGKTNKRPLKHDFLFRRLLSCTHCDYSLIGERQKGHIYYRCHTKGCPTTGVREEAVDGAVRRRLQPLTFTPAEQQYALGEVDQLRDDWKERHEATLKAHQLKTDQLDTRLSRLTDVYLDGLVDKVLFERKKEAFLLERRQLQERTAALEGDGALLLNEVTDFLELAGSALFTYETAIPMEKRELLEILTSNRQVDRKKVEFTLSIPFSIIAERPKVDYGGPQRAAPRIWAGVVAALVQYAKEENEPLPVIDTQARL